MHPTVYIAHFILCTFSTLYCTYFLLIDWAYLGHSDWWLRGSRGCSPQDPHQDTLQLTRVSFQLLTLGVMGIGMSFVRQECLLASRYFSILFFSGLSLYTLHMASSFILMELSFGCVVFLFPFLDMCRSYMFCLIQDCLLEQNGSGSALGYALGV